MIIYFAHYGYSIITSALGGSGSVTKSIERIKLLIPIPSLKIVQFNAIIIGFVMELPLLQPNVYICFRAFITEEEKKNVNKMTAALVTASHP